MISAKQMAPEINRIAVNPHGPIYPPIYPCASPPVKASRAKIELAAKAIIAKAVRAKMRDGDVVKLIRRRKSE